MKAKRIVMAVAVLVIVLAMACALVSCDLFGGGGGSDDKDTTHEVTVQCDTSLGSVSGGGKFKQGDSVTIIATANEGYSFIGWYDGETKVSDQAEWTFSMGEKAISYTAKFSVNSYTVNLDCDLLKGSVTGDGNYEYGSSITISATPNTGYSFIGWYDGENVISTDAEYTFIMGDDNIAWTAKFGINKYIVNLDCETEQGTVTGGGEFAYGSSVTIIAEEKAGYKFIGWYDGEALVSKEISYTFTCINNVNYSAKFEKLNLVQISCDLEQGSVTGGGEFNNGESVTITATAKTGYSFVGWYDGSTLVSTEVRYTFIMGSNGVNYTAKFKANQYSLTLECNSEQGTVTGSGEYAYGSSVTITATENIGYIFDAWYDGTKKISEQANYTFTMVAKNATYTAKYNTDTNYEKLKLTLLDDGTYKITGVTDRSISNIKIPNYISIIGNWAFSGCRSLTSVTIGNSLTSIGNYAFSGCSGLTSITIPDSVTSIGENAFYNCSSLTSVTIGSGVTSIVKETFSGCSGLTSITIGSGVTSIGSSAFYKCYNISEVKYNGTIEQWLAISGLSNLMGYGSNKKLYVGGNEVTGDLVIPDSVTSIGDYAFYNCSGLTSVTIGNSVTSIGSSAFYNCSGLTSITIPDSVTSIGSSAFYDCSNISEVKYNGTIEQWLAISGLNNLMGNYSNKKLYIGGSELTELVIPDSITSIGSGAFYNCSSFTSVTIPDSVTSIGDYAFYGCSKISEVKFDGTIEQWLAISGLGNLMNNGSNKKLYIGDNEITGDLIIADGITSIGSGAFYNCSSLTSVTIPDSVTSIGEYAFYGCSSLTSVTIGNSVTSIGSHAFYDCSSLTSVTIPDSVTSIGSYAFYNCSNLTSVNIPNSITSIGSSAFYNCSNLTSVNIPNSVISIGSYAFYNCSNLTSVIIPDSVKSIDDFAFYDCSSLTSVTIGNSVTSIGLFAFNNCNNLTSITIPDSVTSIGRNAFYNCFALAEIYNLSSLNIAKDSEDNGHVAFYARDVYTSLSEPSKLTEKDGMILHANGNNVTLIRYIGDATNVIIPDRVTCLSDGAFYKCSNLTSVTIPNSVTSIGLAAFEYCSSLTSVTIPDSVTSIGDYAFYGCSNLTSVTIGNSVTSINIYTFYGCSSLTSVTIPNSVTSIGSYAFYNCFALAEIYNLSSLKITKGSSDYGNIAYYALDVYNSLSEPSKLSEKDGMILHTDGNNVTLVKYVGDATSVIIPDGVTSIGYRAFEGCSGLTSVAIPDSVTSIGWGAFEYCSSLTSVIIPDSVTSIGNRTFYNCSSLTSVIFENTTGWFVSQSSNATSGINVYLTDPSQNAKYIKDNYYNYYWKRG